MPPPPCHPLSPSPCPQLEELETREVIDSAVSAKTPSPKWEGPKLGLRNPPRGPSPVLSPALALAPA